MMQIILIGLAAGGAAALLFASIASGSLLATLLFYVSPLPILIAALGWSHWAGLIAAFSAAAGLGLWRGLFFFVSFLVGIGLPAWWLGYLSLLGRRAATGQIEWYPTDRLLLWAAIIGTLIVVTAVPSLGTDLETFHAALRTVFEYAIRSQTSDGSPRPDLNRVVQILVLVMPAAAAVLATLTHLFNLWLAGRIAHVSGRLSRPWPDLSALALPKLTPAILAGAILGSFLPDLAGILFGAFTASLLMAYAIVGFAVLHAITAGLRGRAFMLGGGYAAVIIIGWPVLAMALLGLADSSLNIRGRLSGRRGPPRSST